MHTLIRSIPTKQFIVEQVPVILVSLLIAELFYKFHSFTLEAVAFLITWYVIDAIVSLGVKLVADRHNKESQH